MDCVIRIDNLLSCYRSSPHVADCVTICETLKFRKSPRYSTRYK
jgi:hypothetical protein